MKVKLRLTSEGFPPYQLVKLFLWQMNRFFNLNDISGFLENLSQFNRIKKMSLVAKENDKKSSQLKPKRFLTVQDLQASFFEQSRQDRNMASDELDLVYCCLSIMLGFALKNRTIVQKKLSLLSTILGKHDERLSKSSPKLQKVVSHMKQKLEYFKALEHVMFGDESPFPEKADPERGDMCPSELNLVALHNMQKGNLSKSQLLFKRALLRAKLQNRNMTAREYVDDIYNTNTETKINPQKLSPELARKLDPFNRSVHQSEEYLLYNSALLLIKRGKSLGAVEIFQNLKLSFSDNAQFWYRYGQASKSVFLQDVEHVSRLYDYYFHHKKKKFYAHDRRYEKSKNFAPENYFDDFVNFYTNLVDGHRKNSKSDLRKHSNANLKDILVRRKFVSMFKAKNLLTLTNRLYAQHSKCVLVPINPRNKKKTPNKRNKNFLRPNEAKTHSSSYLTLDEPSLLTKNNVFTILSSLRKSQSAGQSKAHAKSLLHEVHHLGTARSCYTTCISLLKRDLLSRFKVILTQIRNFNQESLVSAYKNKLRRTLHMLLSCYENLAFVTILSQNFYAVKRWTAEGLSFLSNIEKGYLGFEAPKAKRLRLDLTKSFMDNFKTQEPEAAE